MGTREPSRKTIINVKKSVGMMISTRIEM